MIAAKRDGCGEGLDRPVQSATIVRLTGKSLLTSTSNWTGNLPVLFFVSTKVHMNYSGGGEHQPCRQGCPALTLHRLYGETLCKR